ncbi:MAG TPA: two-component regulator propeller domain-containing protein [Candidatus Dormibacteraeota bacterium]|nr:two-component regulator propeller domain-containing protein [Candidatus Dormibacteraeota bacterium]
MKRTSIVWVRAAVAAGLSAVVLVGVAVIWRSSQAMRRAAEDVRAEHEFEFAVQALAPASNLGFEVVSSPQVFQQAARFQDHLYLAGPAGLLEYEPTGALIHQYWVGSDLPGSPLVALAPAVLADSHEAELVIATADDGLLAFNGQAFRQILPASADARAITAILPAPSGHLLFGTKKRGVMIYDGKRIGILHPLLDGIYVTALAGNESDLWIGTLNRGVLHFHAGQVETFAEGQGLPDPDVQSLAITGERTFVGTASGVAVFESGRFSRVLAPGVLATALLATPTQLFVGSEDQGVIAIPLEGHHPNPNAGQGGELAEVRQLFSSGGVVFAVARDGLYRMNAHGIGWERVLQPGAAVLSDRNISALAADANGQIWIGYFDRGLDLLSADERRARHVEDEHVFCVNRILPDTKAETINVATANGLVRFDASGSEQQILTRTDGLIADHVTDVAAYRGGLVLATPAGLTFLDAAGARSMYAFHGLVNNHVYALGVSGDDLMAGTLGGLSQLNQGDVKVNYTTASSNLTHNWITAVVPVGSEWMVGTYGAGVLRLDSYGRFHSYETASASTEINPNAMLVTPEYVLAGTLGQGLYLYDRQSGRWSVIRSGLPSLNVTAFAAANGYIFIGTDNGLVRIPAQKLHS